LQSLLATLAASFFEAAACSSPGPLGSVEDIVPLDRKVEAGSPVRCVEIDRMCARIERVHTVANASDSSVRAECATRECLARTVSPPEA
jgi:hypothetical protein